MRELAEAAGIGWRQAQRAASRLGVKRHKRGLSDGWLWLLDTASGESSAAGGTFEGTDRPPVSDAVTCLAAYGYEVPADGLMHGVPVYD